MTPNDKKQKIEAALQRLCAKFEGGELLASMLPDEFFNAISDKIEALENDMAAINKISMVNELNSGNIGSWPSLAGNTINRIRTITSKWV